MANSTHPAACAEENDKTSLWNRLCETPADVPKKIEKKWGGKFSSIDPMHRLRLLTETFGPCGKGWGFVQEDQWSESGSGVFCVYVRGHLWYMLDGERYETMSHTGGTVADYNVDEVYKMAETDALGKCCVDIGMCADVYMGVHDGDKYQRQESGAGAKPQGPRTGRPKGQQPPPAGKVPPPKEKPIEATDVEGLVKQINSVGDDVGALSISQQLYRRLAVSDALPADRKAKLCETLLAARGKHISDPAVIPSFEKQCRAYVKAGWLAKESTQRHIELLKRACNVTPGK